MYNTHYHKNVVNNCGESYDYIAINVYDKNSKNYVLRIYDKEE